MDLTACIKEFWTQMFAYHISNYTSRIHIYSISHSVCSPHIHVSIQYLGRDSTLANEGSDIRPVQPYGPLWSVEFSGSRSMACEPEQRKVKHSKDTKFQNIAQKEMLYLPTSPLLA
jgi:hypothetical protein